MRHHAHETPEVSSSFEVEDDYIRLGEKTSLLNMLIPHIWPKDDKGIRFRLIFALVALIIATIARVSIAALFSRSVQVLQSTDIAFALIVSLVLAYGIASLSATVFNQLRDIIFSRVIEVGARKVDRQVFAHLLELPLSFHLARYSGELAGVLRRGVEGIAGLLNFMVLYAVPTLVELILVAIVLAKFAAPAYALITTVMVLFYVVYTWLVTEWRIKIRREVNTYRDRANARQVDALLNYETVKSFGNEAHEVKRYDALLAKYQKQAIRIRVSLGLLNAGQGLLLTIGLVSVMVLAGRSVLDGSLSLEGYVLANTLMLQIARPLNFVGTAYSSIKNGLIDVERMFSLLRIDSVLADKKDAKPLKIESGGILFDSVAFGYGRDRSILKSLSFEVLPGQTVALVGPSGSGKSTVGRLLFRFYDPQKGAILIDGQKITDVQQSTLRHAIGMVPQDTVLFNDTIYENIAYGKAGATPEDVEQAAGLASIHDFIVSLPQGYQTIVGERGLKLSGGERQRLAIARTIIKDPPILLFDEATSALDTQTEVEIQKALSTVAKGRTALVIAHRLSTIVDADKIIVLKGGEKFEEGTHEMLLEKKGLYAQLWQQQLKEDEQVKLL